MKMNKYKNQLTSHSSGFFGRPQTRRPKNR
jgi:hypothetical protein